MRRLLGALLVLICASCLGQEGMEVRRADFSQEQTSMFAIGKDNTGLFIEVKASGQDLITDLASFSNSYHTTYALRTDNWGQYGPFNSNRFNNLEPVSISFTEDGLSCVYVVRSDLRENESPKIWFAKVNENGELTDRQLILESEEDVRFIHPSISPDGSQLLVSSNKAGGQGGYDLYVLNKLNEGWSEPFPFGDAVNTRENEIFPQWLNGDVFFSSNGHAGEGGYDVYTTTKESQWKLLGEVNAGINSPQDEFNLIWITDEKAVFSSDRSGANQVYYAEKKREAVVSTGYTGLLECKGTPVQFAEVTVMNDEDDVVLRETTSADGTFSLETLEMKTSYRVSFAGAEEEIMAKSLFYVVNEHGNRIMVFAPGKDGFYHFELLPTDEIEGLKLMDEIDQSRLLTLEIEGQVYEEEPGDVGQGEPISIMDEDGNLIALAYTTDQGKFKFNELSPNATYTFKLDEDNSTLNMVILDNGQEIQVPIQDGKGVYERIKGNEGVTIINEKGEPILIKKDELFVIQHIYYELNSSVLNIVAKYQLDQLADIMLKNPSITIELGSHTDCRGEDDYNLWLSESRANSALTYLTEKGVGKERMTGKGYGETQLLNHCDDNVPCKEGEHALNRRTEIRVIIR